MKDWLSSIFGKSQQAADPEHTIPTGAERTFPSNLEQAVSASVPNDPQAIHAAEAQVAGEWKVGDVILDLYEVKHIHEGGGMGLVYRVYHRGWNTDLAVKSPRSDYFRTEAQKENFTRECETWINLGLHPHIVSCQYVRTLGGIPRVFAEYVEGGTLKEWIDTRKLYDGEPREALKRILDIAIQMAWGLHYAHEQGLVHQDVKPANVLMTQDGTAKITDFGLAKARVAAGETYMPAGDRGILVSTGGMTPAYCSPEQANGEPLSSKSDIWSWAVSVLEIFAGEVAWISGSAAGRYLETLLEKEATGTIPKMPEDLVVLMRICFEREPTARPKDLLVVVEALKRIFRADTAKEYEREEPRAATLQASALNNRGVSLLDLGRMKEAENCFQEVLREQPGHPQAIFNQGLMRWRSARSTDTEILANLQQSQQSRPNDWTVPYLLGIIHLERQDGEGAGHSLVQAKKLGGGIQAQRMLSKSLETKSNATRCVKTYQVDSWNFVVLSADGKWAIAEFLTRYTRFRIWELSGKLSGARDFKGHRHGDQITSAALNRDGRWALSGSEDRTLRLWEVSSGRCLRTFQGHTNRVTSVALSADGCWALSGSIDRTLRLWEVSSGHCLRTLQGHAQSVKTVALSADGRWALSGSLDRTLRLWELKSGRCLRTFEGHTNGVTSVALSADGRYGLSGSVDRTLRLWELESGRCLRTFEGHTNGVTSVALSADGRYGLSGSSDRTLRLWDIGVQSWAKRSICASPAVCLLSTSDEQKFTKILSDAEEMLASGAVAEAASLICQGRSRSGHDFPPLARELSRRVGLHGIRVALLGSWCLRTFEGHAGSVNSIALSADGHWVFSGSEDRTLRLWEVSSGRCLRTFQGHTNRVTSVTLSADGRWALSGSEDQTLRLWEVSGGRCLRTFKGHAGSVSSIALSADGQLGLSASFDRTLRLWELKSGRCVRTIEGHTDRVTSVALSADGRWALSGSFDRTLRLWELSRGCCMQTLEGSTDQVTSVTLSMDGRRALAGSVDRTVRLWELGSGRCVRTLDGHSECVTIVTLSADGRWVLSGSEDRTLRLWDLSNGHCVRTFEGGTSWVFCAALSADGHRMVSGGFNSSLQLWELDWDYEIPPAANFDDKARSYLEIFLTLHIPAGEDGFTQIGRPKWTEEDFQKLITDLQYRGFGWLRPEGVRQELEKMTAEWQGPPKMPWELAK